MALRDRTRVAVATSVRAPVERAQARPLDCGSSKQSRDQDEAELACVPLCRAKAALYH